MRILVLGVSGMLGHQVWLELGKSHYVWGASRGEVLRLQKFKSAKRQLIDGVSAEDIELIDQLIAENEFDVIINCIGVVKQLDLSKEYKSSIAINSLFPHQLASIAQGAKVIQISTDCVFSGKKGNYSEEDFADANDLYGRSKFLGEISYGHHLTLRTSIVGHELHTCHSLFDWFLSAEGQIKGFSNAIYSGLTTLELAKQIKWILSDHFELGGVWQVASKPIDKYSLLKLVSEHYGKEVDLIKDGEFKVDKSLDYSKIKSIGYEPKDWPTMINELSNQYRTHKDDLYN